MYSPGIPLRDPSIDTNYVSAKLHEWWKGQEMRAHHAIEKEELSVKG